MRKSQRTVFALRERGETAQKDVWTRQSRRDHRVHHTRETQERSWFGLALGYDRRGGLALALADADAASNAYRNESCDQSDEYFLHWSSPFLHATRCTLRASLPRWSLAGVDAFTASGDSGALWKGTVSLGTQLGGAG